MSKVLERAAKVASQSMLFKGVDPDRVPNLLDSLHATVSRHAADEVVLAAGRAVPDICIVISGKVQMVEEDYFGNRSIFGSAGPGGMFGAAFAVARVEQGFVTVRAVEDCEVLAIPVERLLGAKSGMGGTPAADPAIVVVTRNLLENMARRNIQLHRKLSCVTRRRTRDKVLAYLGGIAEQAGSSTFTIPLSRQELADYLCVDRSSLSSELTRMQADGLITFSRNRFTLL